MARNLFFILLMGIPAAVALPRNPFQPLVTPCEALTARLEQWGLRGVISASTGAIAIMQDPQKRWRRVTTHMNIEADVPVNGITAQQLSVTLPAECESPVYKWNIKGANDGMDANVHSVGSVAAE
ncbi:DUF2531 family protein [Enterobacteriaceae bacterium H11S18]|uniref:HofP DNA utilization family protein n=1 Tax=Dryocola clanedunensis TaxID=2925396 RepID=UPI0022F080FE|nr:HofP DNA utilization family protein [Dryocola clanedunensis]MCT4705033.1 DUF2531 family protein [Dryocola clanedunensis]MCT4710171.1 DUF2531 family protein [Dryocola clanedunensis]